MNIGPKETLYETSIIVCIPAMIFGVSL
jgi:hypothetical protein